jgi:hypothetical protein
MGNSEDRRNLDIRGLGQGEKLAWEILKMGGIWIWEDWVKGRNWHGKF